MQTYTNFTSTDLSFTNLFVATGHDFHHSLAEKQSATNKFQSRSLFSAWIRKWETTNQPMFVLLKKSYLKKERGIKNSY